MDTPSLSYSYSQDAVSAAVIDQLARTKGWTRFFSVILWIGAVIMIFGGIAMMGMGLFAGAMGEEISAQFAAMGGAVAIGAIYLVMAIFYIYPALKLGSYSSRISALMATPSERNLVAALNEQRAFWKYTGVMMIVMFSLYVVMMIVVVGFAVFAGAAASQL